MAIMLGNLNMSSIEARLGITLKEKERDTLSSMRQDDAQNIQPGKWHCFDLPFMIMCGDLRTSQQVCEILRPYSNSMKTQLQISWQKGESENGMA